MDNTWNFIINSTIICDGALGIVLAILYAFCQFARNFRCKPFSKLAAIFMLMPFVLVIYFFYFAFRMAMAHSILGGIPTIAPMSIPGFVIFWYGVRACYRQLRRVENEGKPIEEQQTVKRKESTPPPRQPEAKPLTLAKTERHNIPKPKEVKPPATNNAGKKEVDFSESDYIKQVNGLVRIMLGTCPITPQDAVDKFMTSKRALGYLFGVHDYLAHRTNLINKETPEEFAISVQLSYEIIFGERSGEALFNATCSFLQDKDFKEGQKIGANESSRYLEKGELPTSFYLILIHSIR